MARFAINSADGQSIRYTGCPTYNGTYLKPSFLEFREIASPTPIDWQVGDYVDYTSDDKCTRTGYRYKLYDIPQPTKKAAVSEYEGAIVYQNVQFFAPTKDLELCPFRDIVLADNNIHFSTRDDVSTFEPLSGIVTRLQANLDDWYGEGVWDIRIASGLPSELVAAISEAREFSVAGGSVLDAINKCYDIFDNIGWRFSVEDDVNVLTFGAANVTPDATNTTPTMKYGFAPDGSRNGLNTIGKTQSNKDEFATRLYAYGSSRNMNFQYYRGDAEIKDAESLDIEHLMIPKEYWGLTDGKYDARKAFLANQAVELAWGKRAKYHYFDGSEDDEIYPSLEGMTIGHIREVKEEMEDTEYVPSETIYTDEDERVDYPKAVVNPADDGVYNTGTSEDIKKGTLNDGITASWYSTWGAGTNWSHTMPTNFGTIELPLVSADYRVTLGAGYGGVVSWNSGRFAQDVFYVNLLVKRTRIVGGTSSEETIGNIPLTIGRGYLDFTFELSDSRTYELVTGGEGVTRDYLSFEIQAGTTGVLPDSDIRMNLSVTNHEISYTLKKFFAEDFTLTLKQIGFSINDRQALGGNGLATVFFNEGMCAGRSFVVKSCEYQSATDDWKLVCTRAYDESTGMAYPNDSYKITTSDRFVLLDIAMPDLYIKVAEERLYARASALLADISRIKPAYSPSIDAQMLAGNPFAIEEGMFMALQDTEVTGGSVEKIIIDSITISESEAAIPTYKVTLREEKGKTFRNGLNSGAVSSTPLTSAKTGEGSGASMNVSGGLASLTVGSVSAVLTTSQWVLGRGFITSQDLSPYRTAEEQNIIDAGKEDKHPYISLERLDKYLYRVTFDSLPEDNGGDNPVSGGCSSYVKDGKLYRNLDFNYDNAASFEVHTRDFVGMSFITGLNDGEMDNEKIAQLPYRIVDGRNNHGIMVSTHVLFNDWDWTGTGDRSISLTRLPFLVLSRVKSMATIADDLDGVLDNLYASAALQATEYLIQVLVTDGTTSYALMPPTSAGQSYVLQNISTYPKLANFRWVNRATVVRTESDIQRRPTGIERYNAMPCPLEDLRFTKCYESADRLSEFIGIDDTTKSSTDAQLTVIYNKARAEYLQRKRDGVTWQTMHSVVYGDEMESLFVQENWSENCPVAHGHSNKATVLDKLKWDATNNAIYIGDADNPINFYTYGEVTAGGVGSGGTPTGAQYLYQLEDVPDYRSLRSKVMKVNASGQIVWENETQGTIIGATMNGASVPVSSGVLQLGTVIREHQSLAAYRTSAAQDAIDDILGKSVQSLQSQVDSVAAKTDFDELIATSLYADTLAASNAYFGSLSVEGGIPKTALASAVQTSLGKADTAYQKPSSGIPYDDLSSGVKGSLNKADSALQASSIKTLTITKNTSVNCGTYNPIGSSATTIDIPDVASATTLANLKSWIESMFEKDTTSVAGTTLIHAKFALYSNEEITAGGVGSGGGGGDIFSTVAYASLASLASEEMDKVPTAWAAKKLQDRIASLENTTPHVSWGAAGADYIPLTVNNVSQNLLTSHQSLSNYYTKTETESAITGKGYITGITKAMVEGVLTGNITTHTHSQYLTASDLTGIENGIKSLQSQIDSVSARDSFDELTVSSMFADVLAASSAAIGQINGLDLTAKAVAWDAKWNTPSNASVLLGITSGKVMNWDAAYNHISNTSNPHSVTWAQVKPSGGVTKSDLASAVQTTLSHADSLWNWFGIDASGNIYVKDGKNFYTEGNISAGGVGSGGSGGGISLIKVSGTNVPISTEGVSDIGPYVATIGQYNTLSGAVSSIDSRVTELEQHPGGVTSFNARTGAITLTLADVEGVLNLTPIENAIKSLQSQVDSVSARDGFDELYATSLFSDIIVGANIYGALHGNADSATNADTLDGQHGSYYATASALSTHVNNTGNPHGVTKTQLGLGNVENKSSATIRSELTAANVTTALGATYVQNASYATSAGNAGTVNNHTVNTDVPAGAVFTDTHDTNVAGTGISVSGTRGSTIAISSQYQTYISHGETAYNDQTKVSQALQSLQSQIDSVAARDGFGELYASYLHSDIIAAGNVYGALRGNADTATNATNATYATYDTAGENISDKFGIVSQALQSLQSQVDSVASRDFAELAETLMSLKMWIEDMFEKTSSGIHAKYSLYSDGGITAGA